MRWNFWKKKEKAPMPTRSEDITAMRGASVATLLEIEKRHLKRLKKEGTTQYRMEMQVESVRRWERSEKERKKMEKARKKFEKSQASRMERHARARRWVNKVSVWCGWGYVTPPEGPQNDKKAPSQPQGSDYGPVLQGEDGGPEVRTGPWNEQLSEQFAFPMEEMRRVRAEIEHGSTEGSTVEESSDDDLPREGAKQAVKEGFRLYKNLNKAERVLGQRIDLSAYELATKSAAWPPRVAWADLTTPVPPHEQPGWVMPPRAPGEPPLPDAAVLNGPPRPDPYEKSTTKWSLPPIGGVSVTAPAPVPAPVPVPVPVPVSAPVSAPDTAVLKGRRRGVGEDGPVIFIPSVDETPTPTPTPTTASDDGCQGRAEFMPLSLVCGNPQQGITVAEELASGGESSKLPRVGKLLELARRPILQIKGFGVPWRLYKRTEEDHLRGERVLDAHGIDMELFQFRRRGDPYRDSGVTRLNFESTIDHQKAEEILKSVRENGKHPADTFQSIKGIRLPQEGSDDDSDYHDLVQACVAASEGDPEYADLNAEIQEGIEESESHERRRLMNRLEIRRKEVKEKGIANQQKFFASAYDLYGMYESFKDQGPVTDTVTGTVTGTEQQLLSDNGFYQYQNACSSLSEFGDREVPAVRKVAENLPSLESSGVQIRDTSDRINPEKIPGPTAMLLQVEQTVLPVLKDAPVQNIIHGLGSEDRSSSKNLRVPVDVESLSTWNLSKKSSSGGDFLDLVAKNRPPPKNPCAAANVRPLSPSSLSTISACRGDPGQPVPSFLEPPQMAPTVIVRPKDTTTNSPFGLYDRPFGPRPQMPLLTMEGTASGILVNAVVKVKNERASRGDDCSRLQSAPETPEDELYILKFNYEVIIAAKRLASQAGNETCAYNVVRYACEQLKVELPNSAGLSSFDLETWFMRDYYERRAGAKALRRLQRELLLQHAEREAGLLPPQAEEKAELLRQQEADYVLRHQRGLLLLQSDETDETGVDTETERFETGENNDAIPNSPNGPNFQKDAAFGNDNQSRPENQLDTLEPEGHPETSRPTSPFSFLPSNGGSSQAQPSSPARDIPVRNSPQSDSSAKTIRRRSSVGSAPSAPAAEAYLHGIPEDFLRRHAQMANARIVEPEVQAQAPGIIRRARVRPRRSRMEDAT
ncbi:hypothetical protein TWF730_007433 [Orbilia blumenaviensis]|uniref:Uncharacterized protein n=1 Tax=Orbilia blumenaviensis TaxID=1796055 RepID=A0AAV9V8Y4_9PEZI